MRQLKYVCIDYWGRPRFIDNQGNYFGNMDILFDEGATFEQVLEKVSEECIYYFGASIDCDPEGRKIKPSAIKLVKEFI